MTTSQKLITLVLVTFGISSLFVFSQFLKSQEQIKKEELLFKEKQQKVSDCKYLLNNEELILADIKKKLRQAEIYYELELKDPNPYANKDVETPEEYLNKVRDEFFYKKVEYENSAEKCRNLLRNLRD